MFFSFLRFKFCFIIVLTALLTCTIFPLIAQTSFSTTATSAKSSSGAVKNSSNLFPASPLLSSSLETPATEWIRLDGRRIFQVTATKNFLSERVQTINNNLEQISKTYFASKSSYLQVSVATVNDLPTINVNGQYLLTITELDAKLRGMEPLAWSEQLSQILQQELTKAKQERRPRSLLKRGMIAFGILFAIAIVNWLLPHGVTTKSKYRLDKSFSSKSLLIKREFSRG